MDVLAVDYRFVAPLARLAAREGVSVKDTANTQWFAVVTSKGRGVCIGAVWCRNGKARIKGDFTLPSERGQGYYARIIRHRLDHILGLPDVTRLEVFQNPNGREALWPNHGFTFVELRANGGRLYQAEPADVRAALHSRGTL